MGFTTKGTEVTKGIWGEWRGVPDPGLVVGAGALAKTLRRIGALGVYHEGHRGHEGNLGRVARGARSGIGGCGDVNVG